MIPLIKLGFMKFSSKDNTGLVTHRGVFVLLPSALCYFFQCRQLTAQQIREVSVHVALLWLFE